MNFVKTKAYYERLSRYRNFQLNVSVQASSPSLFWGVWLKNFVVQIFKKCLQNYKKQNELFQNLVKF